MIVFCGDAFDDWTLNEKVGQALPLPQSQVRI